MKTLLAHPARLMLAVLLLALMAPSRSEAQVFDTITVQDGTEIVGEIVNMVDGELIVKPAFSLKQEISIPWEKVVSVETAEPLPFLLSDGTTIRGIARPAGKGTIDLQSDVIPQHLTIDLSSVEAINPPEVKVMSFEGNVSLGLSVTGGNTQTRNFSFTSQLEARYQKHRIGLRGSYNYADTQDAGVTAQQGKASIKYDYFITERLYGFASAFFEHDGLQDLSLRTALSAGPGYQLIEKKDFEEDWLRGLSFYVEAGASYFNEDFKRLEDNSYVSARWAVKMDWPIIPERLTFFHYHEGYPSLENAKDLYVSTETGVRLNVFENFVATAQVNWRWDNSPPPTVEKVDTLYLLTLGYNFSY